MPTIYSHSRIETFGQCPLRYKFRYIDKVRTEVEKSIEAFMGSMVHEALEKLYKDLRFMYVNTLEELLSYYNRIWEKNFTDGIVIVRKEYDAENYRKMGEQYLTDYYNHYHPFDRMKTVSIEEKIVIDLLEDKRYVLQGYIDRLATDGNGVFEIHDYKTSGTLPEDDKINEDRQLALYSMAVRKKYPFAKNIYLIWHYLKFDQEIMIEKTSEELDDIKKRIIEKIDEIESADEYPAKESLLCDWCDFAPICPKKKHLYKTEKMDNKEFEADDGVRLVTKYADLSSQKKKIEEEIEEVQKDIYNFAEQQKIQNIAGKGVVARIWKSDTVKLPGFKDRELEIVERIIKESGIWDDFSRIDSFYLSKAIQAGKVDPEIIKKLAPYIKKDVVKRIYLKDNS